MSHSDRIKEQIKVRLRPFAHAALEPASRAEVWALYAIAVLLLVAVVALGVLGIDNNSARINEVGRNGKTAAALVQASREEATQRTCEEGNDRHNKTLNALHQVLKKAEAHVPPSQRAAIRESSAPAELIILNIAPRYDCTQRVETLTRQHDPPK